jgi:hypothetical protein
LFPEGEAGTKKGTNTHAAPFGKFGLNCALYPFVLFDILLSATWIAALLTYLPTGKQG